MVNSMENTHCNVRELRISVSLQVDLSDLKKKTLQVEKLARGSPSAELARSLNELGVLYFLQNNHE